MKRNLASLVVVLTFTVFAPVVFAQQSEPPKPDTARYGNPTSTGRALQDAIDGVIKKIGASVLVLDKTKFGVDQTIVLGPKTRYVHDGKASSLAVLKVGDLVSVVVKKDKKTGELRATKVYSGIVLSPAP